MAYERRLEIFADDNVSDSLAEPEAFVNRSVAWFRETQTARRL